MFITLNEMIPNLLLLLLLFKVKEDGELKVGQIIRSSVISCLKSPGSCSVQLSTLKTDFEKAYIKLNSSVSLSFLVPGFQFQVVVTKVQTCQLIFN